ncbi:hypothetical protein CRUP_038292 [Coryphaenoides rupestris]|nr:hypothetical protein CRUP_015364 [Coryphaenoides rupestris]KAG7252341.1 hypothetical protein CRUP_038292 [Coryphaenoides rupestris]
MIHLQYDLVVASTCVLDIYSFPFDTQSCNLSFTSINHGGDVLRLQHRGNLTTHRIHSTLTPEEWRFCQVTVSNTTILHSDVVVYTITMKRRPISYIVNFLLPILFFMCLDLASLFISEKGGEKLSFKVTVMLAVTVLQLILNEILPSMSNKIPLIESYCTIIFALMLFSLLETILVMVLTAKSKPTLTSLGRSWRC